ncbi:hypothetical protein [Rhodococcus sp. JS3073]|nr:hypothetical protein [Rhodococcus sp. JS3073]WAM19462.1 hypothetical protein OYT95_44210 [Rhodococcus sp. JS3073]
MDLVLVGDASVGEASVGELTWLARTAGEVAEQYRDDKTGDDSPLI